MKERKIPLTVLLSTETIAKLEKIANKNYMSLSATARNFIEKSLESA